MLATGVAAVLTTRGIEGAIARAGMALGEMLLLAGAVAGLFATLRVWWDVFLATDLLPERWTRGR